MKRILSDEIFFIVLIGVVWIGAYFYFGDKNIVVYIATSIVLTTVLFFTFYFSKFLFPNPFSLAASMRNA